jgi:3-methylfumaryl-CoA hydratase
MNPDGQDLRDWIGRRESAEDSCDPRRVADMAATLDLPAAPREGDRLPPGWHWMFFNPMARASELGPDGHPRRGGFLPPVALPRRMWAGGRLEFLAPVPVGAGLVRRSEIVAVEPKSGRSGRMVFVVVRHAIAADGVPVLVEEHDIVYREAAATGAARAAARPSPSTPPAPVSAAWRRRIDPDPVLLFRYSALTANGHRIHYDHPYVTGVEGYPGLVFHGPLTATLLMALAEAGFGRPLKRFAFRNMAPLFADAPVVLAGDPSPTGDTAVLRAETPAGGVATQAEASA